MTPRGDSPRRARSRKTWRASCVEPSFRSPRSQHVETADAVRSPTVPITPERLSRLREFGLSEYAARAYLALLDLGVAEARDVSTLSKVPQAKSYHVLAQLHEKGLAVILPEFPKKYAPVPFPEYLDRLHDEHERQAESIDRDREVLAEMFRVIGDADVGNRGFFTVVRGRRNVLAKIAEMLTDAHSDVLVLGTAGLAVRHESLKTEVQEARRRGVR